MESDYLQNIITFSNFITITLCIQIFTSTYAIAKWQFSLRFVINKFSKFVNNTEQKKKYYLWISNIPHPDERKRHTHTSAHAHKQASAHTHTHIHTCVHTHACTHTHTHAHAQATELWVDWQEYAIYVTPRRCR